MRVEADRSKAIDGLRGIAAMAVIVQHCLEFTPLRNADATWATPISYIFSNDFNFGRFGVILFFFISGYLIPSSISSHPRPLLSFAVGRFFRLYPLYWVSIVAALVVAALLGRPLPSTGQVAVNITMFQKAFGVENILDPYWTLFVEHIFYIICAAIFAVGALSNRWAIERILWLTGAGLIIVSVAIMIAPASPYAKHGITLINYPSLIFTMFAGHAIRLVHDGGSRRVPLSVPVIYIFAMAFSYAARESYGGFVGLLSSTSVFNSSAAALIVFIIVVQYDFLKGRSFIFAGKISYGLYLFHPISLWLGILVVGRPTGAVSSILLLLFVVASAVAISTLTNRYVEEPFIEIGKKVRRRLGKHAGPATRPA